MGSDATIEIQKRSVGSTMIYTCGGSLVYVRCQVPEIQFGSMICVAGFIGFPLGCVLQDAGFRSWPARYLGVAG